LPSSPHWAPTRMVAGTVPDSSRALVRPFLRLALDPEPHPDVRVVLGDLAVLDRRRGLQDVHPLDPAERLRRLLQLLRRGLPPGLGGHADEVDRLDHGHRSRSYDEADEY